MIHPRLVFAIAMTVLVATDLRPSPAAQGTERSARGGVQTGAPAAPPVSVGVQTGLKILLLYDMEGVTGATTPQDVVASSQSYPATRESLTADVNAAVAGLLKAGATEVVITDGHGSGNSDPDYLLDKLPKGARFDLRDVPYDPYIETMDRSFAGMVAIAMHGRAGGQGSWHIPTTVTRSG